MTSLVFWAKTIALMLILSPLIALAALIDRHDREEADADDA